VIDDLESQTGKDQRVSLMEWKREAEREEREKEDHSLLLIWEA